MLQTSQVLFSVMRALNMSNFNIIYFFSTRSIDCLEKANRRQFKFADKMNKVIFFGTILNVRQSRPMLRGNSLRRAVEKIDVEWWVRLPADQKKSHFENASLKGFVDPL